MAPARALAALSIVSLCATVSAQQVTIPFDSMVSDVEVTLEVQGVSDTDASPVTGSITIDIEDVDTPVQFVVLDLQIDATESIDHNLNFGFLGSLTQTTTDLSLAYATPGTPSLPAPISNGMYTIPSLDAVLDGMSTYNASGGICAILQGEGLPCSDTLDLSQNPPNTAMNVPGMLTIENGTITFTSMIDVSAPFDPNDPSLGSIAVSGFVAGSAPEPAPACPGDCNDDGSVDFSDLTSMLFAFGDPMPNEGCDANADGAVDFGDLTGALFLFGPCP